MKDKFIKIVADNLKIDSAKINLQVSIDSLGLDSLDFMELVMEVETGLNRSVDMSNLPIECTLQDLLDRVSA